jgi:hypothetical protein
VNLPAGSYYHEAEIVEASGPVSTVTTGKFVLHPSLIPPP